MKHYSLWLLATSAVYSNQYDSCDFCWLCPINHITVFSRWSTYHHIALQTMDFLQDIKFCSVTVNPQNFKLLGMRLLQKDIEHLILSLLGCVLIYMLPTNLVEEVIVYFNYRSRNHVSFTFAIWFPVKNPNNWLSFPTRIKANQGLFKSNVLSIFIESRSFLNI